MKSFEVRFKFNNAAKVRRWTVKAVSEQNARKTAAATLRKASPTARIVEVKEIVAN
jgi:hypothetical protein